MRSLRWAHNLLAGHEADPIPGWLIWSAVTLSLLALVYGVIADWAGFLLNVAAGLVLLGPGLFVTNRVIRNWRHRKLHPLAADTPRHLAVVLRRLGTDLTKGGAELPGGFVLPTFTNDNIQGDLDELASVAGTLGDDLERRAATTLEDIRVHPVPAEITISHAVAQLGYDLDRLDVMLVLPEVQQAWAKIEESVKIWESFRLSPAPAAGADVLLAARDVAQATRALARRLATDLPRHLS